MKPNRTMGSITSSTEVDQLIQAVARHKQLRPEQTDRGLSDLEASLSLLFTAAYI